MDAFRQRRPTLHPAPSVREPQTKPLAGRIDLLFDTAVSLLPHWKQGNVVALATGDAGARPPVARDVSTIVEAGYPQAAGEGWHALIAPAGLPEAIAAPLRAAVGAALADEGFRERLSALGVDPPGDAGAEGLARRIRDESAKWQEAIRVSGARID
jgi:tripartite-type tricarboxylate transporter receptor subunit TctC